MIVSKPRVIASVALLFVAGVCTTLPRALAQDAPASTQPVGKSTLTVTVVDANGAPVEGARVMLLAPTTMPAPSGEAAGHGAHPKPLARGTTDSNGKATLSAIADGDYSVVARLRGKGNGRATVTVASADTDVSVTLKAGKHHGATASDKPATQPSGA